MGIDTSNLYRIEKGKHSFDVHRLVSYLDALGYEVELRDGDVIYCLNSYDKIVSTILAIRTCHKISQRKMSRLVDTTPSAICWIETGQNALTIDMMLKMCNSLGVEVDFKKKKGGKDK